MDTAAAAAPSTVSSDDFRVAYGASTSWVVAKEGLFGDGELGIHHPQLNPPCYHSLCMFMVSQLRAYSAAALKPVTKLTCINEKNSVPPARRKTLCDITNLRRQLASAAHEGQQDWLRCADGVNGIVRLVKENSDLVKLVEVREAERG